MTKYLIIALLTCFGALGLSLKSCQDIKEDRNRLSDNQRTMFEKVTYYRTKDSLSVASVGRLLLTKSELEKYCHDLTATCLDLDIKVKRVQSASTTAVTSSYEVGTPLTFRAQILDDELFKGASDKAMREALKSTSTDRDIVYKTPYITIKGVITRDSLQANIQTYDTIVQIVHRVPRRFLFIRWGTKAIRQEVLSKNPYSNITYTEYIELKK